MGLVVVGMVVAVKEVAGLKAAGLVAELEGVDLEVAMEAVERA